MSKHTPGPWTARPVPNVGVRGHTGYAIDFNEDQEQVVDFVYEEADANLIAAAPDLLEAAERYLKFRHAGDTGMGYQYSGDHPQTQLKNAIARAKGQSK